MNETTIEPLILDLLEWLANSERTYEDVMDAWRTSCPRLTVWEDANERGLVIIEQQHGQCFVKPAAAGLALLQTRGLSRNANAAL